jgi:nitrite reductase/ring-hydroxylating ferredoxin subunit
MNDAPSHDEMPDACRSCVDAVDRRRFLRDSLAATAAALLTLGLTGSAAAALPLRAITPLASRGKSKSYPIPAQDGAEIDRDNDVILVRWQQNVYAFALSCPHQNTALRWRAEDGRFQCPKHKSKYRPDGSFIEGRATRGMDRFAIQRDGGNVVVDLATLYQQNDEPAKWAAAFLTLNEK